MKNIHVLPKQLKQAAEDYSNDRHATINNELVLAFIKGAEWQQQQNNKKYSEEEVDCLLDFIKNNAIETNQGWQINGNVHTNKQLLKLWEEQKPKTIYHE